MAKDDAFEMKLNKRELKQLSKEMRAIEDCNSGHWSAEEHRRFIEAIKIYGKNWPAITAHVSTRNRT